MARASTTADQGKAVDLETVARAMAWAICNGDIVNLRLLFAPFSPARRNSSERFDQPKYLYLQPAPEQMATPEYSAALELVRRGSAWAHIQRELEADRPAQLPWELLMALGDRAVALGKYSSAARAYETLRIRGRMQEEFLTQATCALDAGDVPTAARAFSIASGLAYNYAAFPEPGPQVPDFQIRALMIHGEYPQTPSDCLAAQEAEPFVNNALAYLLLDPAMAARTEKYPLPLKTALAAELVRLGDPEWDTFAQRYREAVAMAENLGQRLAQDTRRQSLSLADEIAAQREADPAELMIHLLGRAIPEGEWWQYLKELACLHPAGVLFIARQAVGDTEVLTPRFRPDNPLGIASGLIAAPATM